MSEHGYVALAQQNARMLKREIRRLEQKVHRLELQNKKLMQAVQQNDAFVQRIVSLYTGASDIPDADLADHINGILDINIEILKGRH